MRLPLRFSAILFFMGICSTLSAQIDCLKFEENLQKIEQKLQKINTVDPDLIPLHYFFILDIEKELQQMQENDIPHLQECPQLDFHQTIERFDDLSFKTKNFKTILADQKRRVDVLYYREAEQMLLFGHRDSAWYDLGRALQYNPTQPDALILKAKLELGEEQFESCVATIHVLYNDATLTREHESAIADLTQELYNALYFRGDSLLQNEHEAEALELFRILETFCHNMPTSYCNDDYYKGIIRSQAGVYQSFLKISEVARKRGNEEIAESFLEYARQYQEDTELSDAATIDPTHGDSETNATSIKLLPHTEDETTADATRSTQHEIEKKQDQSQNTSNGEALNDLNPADCESILREALKLLLNGQQAQATTLLEMARTLPDCKGISIDLLLEILQQEK